jgi:hypothetical protein
LAYQLKSKIAIYGQVNLLYRFLKIGQNNTYVSSGTQYGLQVPLGIKYALISKNNRPLLEAKTGISADFMLPSTDKIAEGANMTLFNSQGEFKENYLWQMDYIRDFTPALEVGLAFNYPIDDKQILTFGADVHYQFYKTMQISASRYYRLTDVNGNVLRENAFLFYGNHFKANYFSFSVAYSRLF